jgi:hypothetical protein
MNAVTKRRTWIVGALALSLLGGGFWSYHALAARQREWAEADRRADLSPADLEAELRAALAQASSVRLRRFVMPDGELDHEVEVTDPGQIRRLAEAFRLAGENIAVPRGTFVSHSTLAHVRAEVRGPAPWTFEIWGTSIKVAGRTVCFFADLSPGFLAAVAAGLGDGRPVPDGDVRRDGRRP